MTAMIYPYSWDTANEREEIDLWSLSHCENIRCKEAIEKTLRENYDGYSLAKGIVGPMVEEYGADRVAWVLASTVRRFIYDGRIDRANKEWATTVPIPTDPQNKRDRTWEYCVNSHLGLVDLFLSSLRREYAQNQEFETDEEFGEEMDR